MTAAVRVSELNELLTLTPDDLFLVSDVEQDSSNKVKFSSLQSNLTLGGLADVSNFSNIQSGQVLQWNGAEFVPTTINSTVVDGDGNVVVDLTPINDALTKIHQKLGVSSTEIDLGDFDGTILPDDSNIKDILEAIEDKFESINAEFAADEAEILAIDNTLDTVTTNLNLNIANLNTLTAEIAAAGYLTAIPAEYVTATELQTELDGLTLAEIAGITGTPGLNQVIKWNGTGWIFSPDTDTTVDLTGYALKTYVDTQVASVNVPSDLVDLSDVFISSANNGEVLTYNAATSGWVPQPLPSSSTVSDLTDLGDVNISGTPTTGHVLKWDGSNWGAAPDGGSGGGGISLTDLSVQQYNPNSTGSLTYNQVTGVFEYRPPVTITLADVAAVGYLTSFDVGDTDSVNIGDDVDLKLYFDSSVGVQTSFIESDALIIRSKTNNDEYATFLEGGPVELYYDGSKRFGTSQTGATVLGDLEVDGKLYFKNVFSNLGDLPSAVDYHGMFAHVHGTGAAYYAHGGNWVELAKSSDVPSLTGYATETYVNTQISNVSVPSDLNDLADVSISGTPTTGHVLKFDGSNWAAAPDGGSGGGGISLTDLSVTQNAASGSGALTYNDVSGVFEYTPPAIPAPSVPALLSLNGVDSTDTPANDDVLVYSAADSEFKLENLTSIVNSLALQNIADAGYGVDVTGKIATTDGIDIDIGGSINAAGTTVDFQNTTISFTGASIGGLSPSDVNLDNIANAGYGVDVTGKIAVTDGIDISIGGSINAAGTTVDFQNTTISFTGASIGGLDSTIRDSTDTHLNKSTATDGQILSWDTSANAGNGDYAWVTPATGGGGASDLDGLTDVSTVGVSTGQVLKYNGTSWAPADDIDTDTNVDLTSVNSTLTQLSEFNQNLINETAVSGLEFTANNTAGSSPMSVSLNVSYAGNADKFDVDWGDGTQDTDVNINQLSHTYNNAGGGLFDVSVTAKNSNGVGFGSTSISGREDYIVLYTPQPVLDFEIRKSLGGSAVTGNNRWVLIGDDVYLTNDSTNVTGVNATFEYNWGDGSISLTSNDTDPGAILGPAVSHAYTLPGWYTLTLKLTGHDATDPAYLNTTTTDNIKVYNPNPAAPTGLAGKLNDVGGSSALLASGFTDNTGGAQTAGTSVKRLTSGSAQTSMSSYAYNADSGTLRALRNGVTTGQIFMNQPHNQYLTDGELALNGESDYNLLTNDGNSTSFANGNYYPGLHKGFKARTITNYTAADAGLNVLQLAHSETGDSNERYFVKDTTTSPTLDVSSVTVTEVANGAKKFVSGIPYYSGTNSTIRVSGAVVDNLTTECYDNNSPVNLLSDNTTYAGSSDPVSSTNYSYSQSEGGVALLNGSIPFANVTNYTLGDLDISPASNRWGSKKLRMRVRNINGYSSYSTFGPIIQNFTTSTSSVGIDETDIEVSTSLGNGSLTDGGVRIMDFKNETTDTPAFNSGTNYYTNDPYTESTASNLTGVLEAAVIYGDIDHDTTDYSTGYLPVGPDRSGSTGTQYFTFAFRRQVVANFSIRLNTGGIAGCWIAAPGTAIDSASGLNGWLDTSQAFAGSGVPGSDTGNGGNGSDGCATNNSNRILTNTSMNGTYTMTLGEENMSNATGNVVLVRIALNSGQSISTLEVN